MGVDKHPLKEFSMKKYLLIVSTFVLLLGFVSCTQNIETVLPWQSVDTDSSVVELVDYLDKTKLPDIHGVEIVKDPKAARLAYIDNGTSYEFESTYTINKGKMTITPLKCEDKTNTYQCTGSVVATASKDGKTLTVKGTLTITGEGLSDPKTFNINMKLDWAPILP